jgi:methyl-galactoside transport system ATP-binding protein
VNGNFLLQMKNISKSFPGVQALKQVNLSVRAGEFHALMGENGAGKSTLMKCLFGLYHMDEGEVLFQGKPVRFSGPFDALKSGIAMVQQELEQVPQRSVMDNIWLGRYPRKGPFVDEKRLYEKTIRIIKDFQIEIDPRDRINQLSVSMKQMVEIIKAVSYDARIIVLDEPTSSLTEKETQVLFAVIERLKSEGRGIIYISHKIDEVLQHADTITVLRDGAWVDTRPKADMSADTLIKLMVNREMKDRFPAKNNKPGRSTVKVEHLSTVYPLRLHDISFEAYAGEILGIGGLVGSGRTELLESMFGLRKISSGSITVNGKTKSGSAAAKDMGIALLTEERRATGCFPLLDIRWNTVASSLKKNRTRMGFISKAKVAGNTQWAIGAMNIKTTSMMALINNLSGGNQQKVLMGRCLLNDPDVLLLDEPTRGIDVGAKYEIYQLIIDLAQKGKTIIMTSSEMPELLGIANRILVMSNGRSAGIIPASQASQEQILKMATAHL